MSNETEEVTQTEDIPEAALANGEPAGAGEVRQVELTERQAQHFQNIIQERNQLEIELQRSAQKMDMAFELVAEEREEIPAEVQQVDLDGTTLVVTLPPGPANEDEDSNSDSQ